MRFDKKVQAIKAVRVSFERDNNVRLSLSDCHEFICALEESTDQRIMTFIELVNGAPARTNDQRIKEAVKAFDKWESDPEWGALDFLSMLRAAVE